MKPEDENSVEDEWPVWIKTLKKHWQERIVFKNGD
jgi:hypothetical protein